MFIEKKETHFLTIQDSIYQENIRIINISTQQPNSKHVKQKMDIIKGEIDNSIITVRNPDQGKA